MLGRLRELQDSFWQALEFIPTEEDTFSLLERGDLYYQLAITETVRGYPLKGLEYAREALLTHQKTSSSYGKIADLSVMSLADYFLGNNLRSRESALRGIELADRVDGWRMNGYLCSYAGMCEVELGLVDAAWNHAQKAIGIGRRKGHGEIVGMGFRVLGDLYLQLDAIPKASEAYQQGLLAAGQHFVALELMCRFGYSQFLLGQELGRRYLLQGVNTALQADMGGIVLLGVLYELSMYALTGEQYLFESRAVWQREQLQLRVERDTSPNFINRIRAEVAFKQGDYQQAYSLAADSIAWYRSIQNRWAELALLGIMEQSAEHLGLQQGDGRAQIDELLNEIARSLKTAPLDTEWQAFLQKMAV